jgi:hypothetical protein
MRRVVGWMLVATLAACAWLQRGNWRPVLADFKLGWEQYANVANTLWFDDIAVGTRRIGCSTP